MSSIADMPVAKWRKAWTEIAVAFETEPSERTEEQIRIAFCGLCLAAKIAMFPYDENCPSESYTWGLPPLGLYQNRDNDLLRSTHAAFFAAMTPKEFIQICEAEDE